MEAENLASEIQEFRSFLAEDLNGAITDEDCKRFLVARKHEIDKAVEMITEWWKWWHTPYPSCNGLTPANILNVHNIVDPKVDIINRCAPHSFSGFGKNRNPIFWEKTGTIVSHLGELKDNFSLDELMAQHIRMQTVMNIRCQHISKMTGTPVEQVILVCDYKGMPMAPDFFAIEYTKRLFGIDQNYYPERLYRTYVINAPWFFTALYSLVSAWIDPNTAAKIRVLGSNYLSTLREEIDDCDIPVEYGGSCEKFRWGWPYSSASGASPEQLAEHLAGLDEAYGGPSK